jgi:hypothetical protein
MADIAYQISTVKDVSSILPSVEKVKLKCRNFHAQLLLKLQVQIKMEAKIQQCQQQYQV